jgi:hypothetical protein
LAAAIATLIATSESPPTSKKLALRSITEIPRHCAQIRATVASICEALLLAGAAAPFSAGDPAATPVAPAPKPLAGLCSIQYRCRAKG